MANDLDDLDEAEGGPQPPQGRELGIVDLGHETTMHHQVMTDRRAGRRPDSLGRRTDGQGPGPP
jgi:hypothetical protein